MSDGIIAACVLPVVPCSRCAPERTGYWVTASAAECSWPQRPERTEAVSRATTGLGRDEVPHHAAGVRVRNSATLPAQGRFTGERLRRASRQAAEQWTEHERLRRRCDLELAGP